MTRTTAIMTGPLLLSLASFGAESEPDSAPPNLEHYATLVSELAERRRLNVLFPNPQSIFDGMHVGFVNVGTGNLSFKRHDMVVRVAGTPVYLSRVYDSRARGNEDFGGGWRLSLGEEIIADDGKLTYIDASGASHTFSSGTKSDVFAASPPTPRHGGSRLWANGGDALLEHADGTTKRRFAWSDVRNRYLLTEVSGSDGETKIDYDKGGLIARISMNEKIAFTLARDGKGRVTSATDRFGRSVSYSYTANGMLKDVYDVAGGLWQHRYDDRRRLTNMAGPMRDYIDIAYDKEGRVVYAKGALLRTYAYGKNRTVVGEGPGRRMEFDQNDDGITYAYNNSASGVKWHLSLDAGNRVEQIFTPAGRTGFTYNAEGRVMVVIEESGVGKEARSLSYNAAGHLTSASHSTGTTNVTYGSTKTEVSNGDFRMGFERSSDGRVGRVHVGSTEFTVGYKGGMVSAFGHGADSVEFRRDDRGRIVGTTFPDGSTRSYAYDALGNRTRTRHSLDQAEHFRYDGMGNLVEVTIDSYGTLSTQTYQIGDMHRVERITGPSPESVDIGYDSAGRPNVFTTSGGAVRVEYDGMGRISNIRSETHDVSWVPDGEATAITDAHDTTEAKRVALAGRDAVRVQPYYGSAVFDPETFAIATFEPLRRLVPGLEDALSLWEIAEPLLQFGHDGAVAFDKPSNPAFQPDEYRSTNCCLPCLPGVYVGCVCQLLETLLVVCGCLPSEDPTVSEPEKEPTCLPCDPEVGTRMYLPHVKHRRHPDSPGRNHGVPGDSHIHHVSVHQSPPSSPKPCNCFTPFPRGDASATVDPGEIRYVHPTGGGIDPC